MSFGVTSQGFKLKRLQDIASETTEKYQAEFGPQIDLEADSPLGQQKGIMDDQVSQIWELGQNVYNSQYPQTASDTSLDNVASITGDKRLIATKSTVTGRIFGTLSSAVPIGFTASVTGNSSAKFLTVQSGVVGAGIDEVQTITFSSVPTSGTFELVYNGTEVTSAINWNDNAATIQTELNGLASLSTVTVSGDFTNGFVVTFTGADGQQEQPLLTTQNNSLDAGGAVTITVTETTKGYGPFVDLPMEAENTGPTQALSGTLTVIETPEPGITGITNLLDADLGRNVETDPDFRQRRNENLQKTGTTTLGGIRAALLEVENVDQVEVIENDSLTTDAGGRPGKSYECFVLSGADQDIGQVVWDTKPAGIQTHGDIDVNVTDSQGVVQTVSFSRPSEINIWLIVNITKNTDSSEGPLYPTDGDDQVQQAILDYTQDFRMGQDVINNQLYIPVNTIAGVIGIEILQGTAPAPTLENNISVDPEEIARFDSSRITVNS